MKNVRKFWLQRGLNGERFDLNGASGVWATNPSGLGITLAPSFYDLGDGHFQINNDRKPPQGTPTCDLVFPTAPYATYRRLANWILATEDLYLIYCPYGDTEFMRRVTLNFLTKGELGQEGWLTVPAAVYALSPWFLPTPTEMDITVRTGPLKEYAQQSSSTPSGEDDYGYIYTLDADAEDPTEDDYWYVYGGNAESDMSAQIPTAGHQSASLLLRYHGAIVSPGLRLVGLNSGRVYGICSLSARGGVVLSAGDTLEYSSDPSDMHISRISADGQVTDLLPWADLSLGSPYFRAPQTEPTVLSLESTAQITGSAELTVNYYYGTV